MMVIYIGYISVCICAAGVFLFVLQFWSVPNRYFSLHSLQMLVPANKRATKMVQTRL